MTAILYPQYNYVVTIKQTNGKKYIENKTLRKLRRKMLKQILPQVNLVKYLKITSVCRDEMHSTPSTCAKGCI